MLQIPLEIQLDDNARFTNYFEGDNCQLIGKLELLPQSEAQFLYIWGAAASGKSHLAQAICQNFADQNLTAIYLPLDNHLLKPGVLDGLEYADVVCLDNFDAIAGNIQWEQGCFNLFNNLKSQARHLVIFNQHSVRNIEINLADLMSRLNSMEVYRLNSISDEQRIDFVQSLGAYRGLDISKEVAQFLLARSLRDVNDLVDSVRILDKQSLAHQRKITIPFVKSILNL